MRKGRRILNGRKRLFSRKCRISEKMIWEKTNISQNLFQRFKELITNGQLPAGYMMPNENVVSEQLGIGRSTLREAYTALAVFGFIRRSKAGTFVNEIDNIVNIAPFSITVENSDLNDLLEFRYMLEGETASYAAKRATQDDIAQLEYYYGKNEGISP